MDGLVRVRHRLPRRASLKNRTWIRALFDRSEPRARSLAAGCIRLVFRLVSDVDPRERGCVFVGFSPGQQMRGAVKRNRVKRLLRECYRLEQGILMRAVPDGPEAFTMMIVFRGTMLPPFAAVRDDMCRALTLLASRLPAKPPLTS